ncbi:MAG TPA: SDR family oxidoreductase, partial [Nonomuraea sp.]|nr:SDR family oxidoreductase [Nonomuraea sp.]
LAYLGAAHVARAAYPVLRETGGTLVLQSGGGDGSLAAPARAATAELARALAAEWAPDGIRVNAVLAPMFPSPTSPANAEPPDQPRADTKHEADPPTDAEYGRTDTTARACLDAIVSGLTGQVVEA